MSTQQIALNIFSIILSGVLATLINLWYQKRQQILKAKIGLIEIIFGYRYQLGNWYNGPKEELMRALNKIPIVFANSKDVINAYNELYQVACTSPMNNENLKDNALIKLLKEMCRNVKIGTKWDDSYYKNILTLR
ncbi:hypothetical protein Mahau_2918 [Mahella australiensis 50-1 BON]|uniref:DUF6680 domain-containing protein n=2 Tax=Mahella TaxID=252965 RepID=F4A0W2_MAHA5|nr:hypothetical protein Mahau_2918 [Mahella australiensis 50-1 BON]